MSTGDEIKARLIGSYSVASMAAEQEVIAAFKRGDWWRVEHGSFFRDVTTGKLRELDVRASRHWSTTSKLDVTLEVLVEVKSMRGYHLVFAPDANGYDDASAQRVWLGQAPEAFRSTLIETGAGLRIVKEIEVLHSDLSHPNGVSAIDPLLDIAPPPAQVFATAFRETNVGSEKELDNSVL